jgi:hypothetical protein
LAVATTGVAGAAALSCAGWGRVQAARVATSNPVKMIDLVTPDLLAAFGIRLRRRAYHHPSQRGDVTLPSGIRPTYGEPTSSSVEHAPLTRVWRM